MAIGLGPEKLSMQKGRLEAFSDGVIAILITIMVLELSAPHGTDLAALRPLLPTLLAYVLSFAMVGIYWTNHHHLLHAADRVNGRILLANLHLLFWLSLLPFGTAWMGDNGFAPVPTAAYGALLLMSAIAYTLLQLAIVAHHGPHSRLAQALGSDTKGKISMALYAVSIPLAFVDRRISLALFVTVSLIWFIPDRRIESKIDHHAGAGR